MTRNRTARSTPNQVRGERRATAKSSRLGKTFANRRAKGQKQAQEFRLKTLADINSRHTPARCGAAGVISLFGGFGGPHPHAECFDLSPEINEDKNELGPDRRRS
jgi:hypothetical protein